MRTLLALASILALVLLAQAKDRNNKPHKVVCYFASWTSDFTPASLNPNVCTHVNFAFAKLVDNKISVQDPSDLLHHVTELRKKNPHLTVLISLGGWSDGSTKYSVMARSAATRSTFIHSVVDFLAKHDLDGLDFDWEFPAFSGVEAGDRQLGRVEDKQDFVTLLSELKTAFRPHGYLLTGAITSSKYNVDHAYDIAAVSHHLDFINLMTYDYHGPWSHTAGHNSPLHSASTWSEEDKLSTIQWTVDYFRQHGADAKKLIVGIPLYGYVFTLANAGNAKVGAAVSRGADGGTYGHICAQLKPGNGWVEHWDEAGQVPYATHGDQWLTYENVRSVNAKLAYITQQGLGGAMVWEVNGDDFQGHCGAGKFPIMKLLMKTLNHVDVHD